MKLRCIKRVCVAILIILGIVGLFHVYKSLPSGISIRGESHVIAEKDIEFLYDLTYTNDTGDRIIEQTIFDEVFSMIEEAKDYIVIDAFLFNTDFGDKEDTVPLTNMLTDALIAKKEHNPDIQIFFITDPINTFYGSYDSFELTKLEDAGIKVILTDLEKLRDSNPLYSSVWRTFIQWFGTKGDGFIAHPLGRENETVTIRSFLSLLNTKANHRKVFVTDSASGPVSLVTSANPHNASSLHSNVALKITGDIAFDIIKAEEAVARLSGYDAGFDIEKTNRINSSTTSEQVTATLITEREIKKEVLELLKDTADGDIINLSMFYLSDRDIARALISSSKNGAEISVILDANKDAFGREKNGIPNRQVAYELIEKTKDFEVPITIKWYKTTGEQFHTKLLYVKKGEAASVVAGSANYTRRNLDDLNLEMDVVVSGNSDLTFFRGVEGYFNRLWNNSGGIYTLDYTEYKDSSRFKTFVYRVQEFAGLSSF